MSVILSNFVNKYIGYTATYLTRRPQEVSLKGSSITSHCNTLDDLPNSIILIVNPNILASSTCRKRLKIIEPLLIKKGKANTQ